MYIQLSEKERILSSNETLNGLNEELKHNLQEKIIEKEKELNSDLISQIKDMKNLSDEDIKILKDKIAEIEKEKNEK